MERLGILSRGIASIPYLRGFFPETDSVVRLNYAGGSKSTSAIAGWGRKRYAKWARAYAKLHKLPYVTLEDGFLRSYSSGGKHNYPLSIICDKQGVYYDSSTVSDLEALITQPKDEPLLQRARDVMALIKEHKLSKYNSGVVKNLCDIGLPENVPYVLLVDQCAGDASITYGGASEKSFRHMLQVAIRERPHYHYIIKTHPDVISGKRKGYLSKVLEDYPNPSAKNRVHLVSEDINPHVLFANVQEVYTVTSLLGFEALMAGKRVRVFGQPFYAGWGLTEDVVPQQRRRSGYNLKLENLVAAAYIEYPRYVDPYTGRACEVEDTIALLAWMRKRYARITQHYHCVAFARWKRAHVTPFLATPKGSVHFHSDVSKACASAKKDGGAVLVWGGRETLEVGTTCRKHGVPLYRMEDGFIRSHGLGVDLVYPSSLILDKTGIHYDADSKSELFALVNQADYDNDMLLRARELRKSIAESRVTKYNTEPLYLRDIPELAGFIKDAPRPIIFIPGQVEGDASIRYGNALYESNREFIAAVRGLHPEATILYKPHPDVQAGLHPGDVDAKFLLEHVDYTIDTLAVPAILPRVDEVHTMTSTVGFEALMQQKKVVTYGKPFYAGWGLTVDKISMPERRKDISLDALVAAVLIDYPLYFDWHAHLPSTAENTVVAITRDRQAHPDRILTKWQHKCRQIWNGLLCIVRPDG